MTVRVELIRAWPRRFEQASVELPAGARVRDAVAAAGWEGDAEVTAYAVFGRRVEPDTMLGDGDRVELLRPLVADPKDARRRRAALRGP